MFINSAAQKIRKRLLGGVHLSSAPQTFARETRFPSHQNAIDLISGWNHAFPSAFNLNAGPIALHEDVRIHWAIEQLGGIQGKTILELGPLEGSHTYILDRGSPASLDAIEANQKAYLRCLIAKQIYQLRVARFHLGNFVPLLQDGQKSYDLIVASGVLYHMRDPVRFLELLGQRSNAIYLWTHYYSEEAMPPGDQRSGAFLGKVEKIRYKQMDIHLHTRSYHGAARNDTFCGGPNDQHYWMEKSEILAVLEAIGFSDIRTTHDHPAHPNGPSISIFAKRS